tara:strand:- start:2472 stop:2591 length:120 start_codon:yes stop_codon:yes gene_type:complete
VYLHIKKEVTGIEVKRLLYTETLYPEQATTGRIGYLGYL